MRQAGGKLAVRQHRKRQLENRIVQLLGKTRKRQRDRAHDARADRQESAHNMIGPLGAPSHLGCSEQREHGQRRQGWHDVARADRPSAQPELVAARNPILERHIEGEHDDEQPARGIGNANESKDGEGQPGAQ